MALTVLTTLNEGSTAYFAVTCTNHLGVTITPATVAYMVYDITAGAKVLDWTTATPGDPTVIHITEAETTLLTGQSAAIRAVRVIATYGADDQATSETLYGIKELSGPDQS